MNYHEYAARLSTFVSMLPDEIDYSIILPATIDFAEQRVYRELDLLSTVTRDNGALVAGERDFTLPSTNGKFVTVQSINVVTPADADLDTGSRNPLLPVSRDFLDSVWGSGSASLRALPTYFSVLDGERVILGPWPDAPYPVEVIGTIRPTPLSQSNPTTFLTLYLPDVFVSASMMYFSRVIMEMGGQVQGGPEYWLTAYESAKQSAMAEELRKKFAAGNWSAVSTPNR